MEQNNSQGVHNAFTVDVEDYFHIIGSPYNNPALWEEIPSRTSVGLGRILDLVAELGIKATMFVLGTEAQKNPGLIKQIAASGHEIACHGMFHCLLTSQTTPQFRDDIRTCRFLLEDLSGNPVVGFRAPGYSLTPAVPWVWDVLAEEGFLYDSSIVPTRVKHGGWKGAPNQPYRVGKMVELPIASTRALGKIYVWGAGGRLRITPGFFIKRWWRRLNRQGLPAIVLVHPREMDSAMPHLAGLSWKRNLISGWGVKSYYQRLARILSSFRFLTCKEIAQAWIKSNR